jgi:hypothetical protein
MILLDSKRPDVTQSNGEADEPITKEETEEKSSVKQNLKSKNKKEKEEIKEEEEIAPDDIPF